MPRPGPAPGHAAAPQPKRNGHVERANGTRRRELWEYDDGDLEFEPLRTVPRAWEAEDHRVRLHQALGYLTPAAYLDSSAEAHP